MNFEAGGVTAALTLIAQRKAGDPAPFQASALGVSLTAPPDWVIHPNANHRDDLKIIHLLDPVANADALQVRIRPTENLSAVARNSANNWAEADFPENVTNEFKDAKLRADGWKNYTVDGRAGVSFTADYTDQERSMVVLCLYVLGPKSSEVFRLSCAADKLEAVRSAFESIVASYRSK